MQLKDIVKDWGGFEQLVKSMHDSGSVEVEHNVTLTGKSGATRQIDVLLTHHCQPYTYLTLIECKYWKRKVERANIDVLAMSISDLGAAKGVFFTCVGYQEGAEIYAKSMGITIHVVRELTDEEWGLPGKIIDLYLQFIQPTIIEVTPIIFNIAQVTYKNDASPPLPPELSLHLGDENREPTTSVISKHKKDYKSLEAIIDYAATESTKQFTNRRLLINSGEKCTRYFRHDLNINFPENLVIQSKNSFFEIPEIKTKIGIKVDQSRLTIDRSTNYLYVLAVQDCITKEVYASSKHREDDYAHWAVLSNQKEHDSAEIIQNGSIITITMKGYFAKEEMDGLTQSPMEPLINTLPTE